MTINSTRPAAAQERSRRDTRPAFTLAGWQERLHVTLMDRRHATGGYFFDRGVFHRLTPVMDHEYLLDQMTYGFTPGADARWEQHAGGYRSYMGSIDKSHFITRHEIHHRLSLGSGISFSVNGHFQEDLRASRSLVAPGLSYRWGSRHRAGFEQTFARYKPDLDLRLFYELHDPRWGRFRMGVTALDLANNFIFEGIGVDPTLEDTVRIYARRPWLLAARAQPAAYRGFRLELAAGVQTPSRARVSSQRHPRRRFSWRERASYAGALLTYRVPLPAASVVGVQYRHTFSRMARGAPDSSVYTSDYGSRQTHTTFAGLARVHWRHLRLTGQVARGSYNDRQRGTDFDQSSVPQAFDYEERFWKTRVRLLYAPNERGPVGGLKYLALRRDYEDPGYETLREAGVLTFGQTRWNHRLVLIAGYQFAPAARVVAGAGYDLDGDQFHQGRGPVRFDGGFGRLLFLW